MLIKKSIMVVVATIVRVDTHEYVITLNNNRYALKKTFATKPGALVFASELLDKESVSESQVYPMDRPMDELYGAWGEFDENIMMIKVST